MKLSYGVATHIEGTMIKQEVFTEWEGIRNTIMRQTICTTDQQVREALIRLGWTPPAATPGERKE